MSDSSPLLGGLNEAQRRAVLHGEGPLVVFAGAGSGKTRIITTRIAWLIEQGVPPWEILAVTFTNKAAAEMKERVAALNPQSRRSLITTFHSACARWLREFAGELGFESNYTIYDDGDTRSALKNIVKNLQPEAQTAGIAENARAFIHMAKTNGWLPADVEKRRDQLDRSIPPGGLVIYRAYQDLLASSNAMDFDDLLLNFLLLMRRNEKVRSIMQKRYRHILVDEFQDTNGTQFEIVNHLAGNHRNLFVVGDDDQSIYSWRGATPAHIIDFNHTWPDAGRVALEQNYRCTGHIIEAAAQVIARNQHRAEKTLFTENHKGDLLEFSCEADHLMEAEWVVDSILREKQRFPTDNVAVFYRTNSQSRAFEEVLTRRNVPYTIFGSLEFYARMEVKDLLAWIRLIVNPQDEVALRRVINVPARGIGQKAVERIEARARQDGVPMLDAVRRMADEGAPRVGPKLRYFIDLVDALRQDLRERPPGEVLSILLEATEYQQYLQDKFPEQVLDKVDNIQELGTAMVEFEKQNPGASLEEWVQTATLNRDEGDENAVTGVSLMTLHMAKGLEFRRVYLVGLEEGILPHHNSLDSPAQLEEERRLFYVGLTRAREKISLLCASRRRTFNQVNYNEPSRFLQEIPAGIIQGLPEEGAGTDPDELTYTYDDQPLGPEDLRKGAMVSHPTYGRGVVSGIEHHFGQERVIVNFFEFGPRRIRPGQLSPAAPSSSVLK